MSFYSMMERILSHEGGLSLNPLDRGNWTSGKVGKGKLNGTKFGISAMTYPNIDIRNLTRVQALKIYERDFYAPLSGTRLRDPTIYQLLDFAVNSGVRRAVKSLQKAVGTARDGILGPITCKAATDTVDTDLLLLILADRLEFMASLSSWGSFSRGWAKRIAINLRYAAEDT